MHGWVSPRLQIRFELRDGELDLFRPDGARFLTYTELAEQKQLAEQRADYEGQRADQAEQRADYAEQRADHAAQRAKRLAAQLRALGIEPENDSP